MKEKLKKTWPYFIPFLIILPLAIYHYKEDYGFEFFFMITLIPMMIGLRNWFKGWR